VCGVAVFRGKTGNKQKTGKKNLHNAATSGGAPQQIKEKNNTRGEEGEERDAYKREKKCGKTFRKRVKNRGCRKSKTDD